MWSENERSTQYFMKYYPQKKNKAKHKYNQIEIKERSAAPADSQRDDGQNKRGEKVTEGGSVRWVKVFVKGSIGPCGRRLEALNNVCQLLE